MPNSLILCWSACGLFFLIGLLTGLWKYIQITHSEKARAHYYVDIAHRASLMYSFSCIVLAKFVEFSAWSETVNFWAALGPIVFFGLAIQGYIVHGFLQDTNNQLRKPHTLGKGEIPDMLVSGFMWALATAEIGGFVVLLAGFAVAQF